MLGASPITMSTSELYLAFQQGVVDGHENALSSVKAWSYFEVQDYLWLSGHVYTAITLAMNGDRWDGLSDEMKDAFQRAADKAVAWSRQASVENDERPPLRQPRRGAARGDASRRAQGGEGVARV